MTASESQIPWTQVWSLFLKHRAAFDAVFLALRRRGFFFSDDIQNEFIHAFLVERARAALATYRHDRGPVDAWLFVVFRHFVLGSLRARRRMESLPKFEIPELLDDSPEDFESNASPSDLERVRTAIEALPDKQRQALEAFLSPEGGTVRSVARSTNTTRWRARALLFDAVSAVAKELGDATGTSTKRLRATVAKALGLR